MMDPSKCDPDPSECDPDPSECDLDPSECDPDPSECDPTNAVEESFDVLASLDELVNDQFDLSFIKTEEDIDELIKEAKLDNKLAEKCRLYGYQYLKLLKMPPA